MSNNIEVPIHIERQLKKLTKAELQALTLQMLQLSQRQQIHDSTISEIANGSTTNAISILQFFIDRLIRKSNKVIQLGDNNQIGSVTTRDIAGRDIINIFFNYPGQETTSRVITPINLQSSELNNNPDNPKGLPVRLRANTITIRKILASYTTQESGSGYFSIHGEMYNDSEETLYMPDVEASFFDSEGSRIEVITGSGQRFCNSMVLGPKAKTPFHYYTYSSRRDMDRISQYNLQAFYSPRYNGWIEVPFDIVSAGHRYDNIVARNTTNSNIQGMRVIYTIYDEQDRVCGIREDYIGNVIYPEGRWTFNFEVPSTPYELKVEGRSK